MLTDLKYALRQLLKAPAFTVTALATVAICLGANLALRIRKRGTRISQERFREESFRSA